MLKRMLCAALALLLALGVLACGAPAGEPAGEPGPEIVMFTDAVLEARVREAMGKPEGDITVAEAEAVTELVMNNDWPPPEEVVTDISSLKYFPSLTKLELTFHGITDISVLAELTKLQYLALGGNAISDISALTWLADLDSLLIWGNQITDLSALAGMTRLHALMIGGCPISDIGVLANLKELGILDMTNCQVGNISPLAGLPLWSLKLNGNPIEDFGPIEDIYPSLEEKDFELLSADDVPDEPLAFADANFEKALRTAMGIADRPITQKDAYLTQSLEITSEKSEAAMFSDIGPLACFVNLKKLSFNANKISDLSPLSNLTKLTELNVGYNGFRTFRRWRG